MYNISISKSSLRSICKDMKLDGSECIEEDLQMNFVNLGSTFANVLKKSGAIVDNVSVNLDVKVFRQTKTAECIQTNLGDVYIASSWYDKYKVIFDKQILNEFPKMNKVNIFPSSSNIFDWTFYTNPNELKVIFLGQEPYVDKTPMSTMSFAFDPSKVTSPECCKTLFQKMCHQLNLDLNFNSWYIEGNFYKYIKHVLFINSSMTIQFTGGKVTSHTRHWKSFLISLISQFDVSVVSFGSEAKSITDKLSCKCYNDIDPLVKIKPSNYLDEPPYFKDLDFYGIST